MTPSSEGAPEAAPAADAAAASHPAVAELAEMKDRYLRLAAEFDNFRKRSAKERGELADKAQAQFVGRLLDVLDDLNRIVASDPGSTPAGVLRDALTAVDRKLWKELESAGVERVEPTGEPFDPATQEAVSLVPAAEGQAAHTVSATFQVGYRFKGQLVRPARVQVTGDGSHG
ncbi:MAG: nucleotide exchange factor GrpE [Gemmatimonadales bacterium]|nr:nucleotide exchange factor GrpE [Gemmatimonadales bacterium]